MSANNFHSCLGFTLQQEGGWANNPNDPGGCTMEGVTLATYQSFKGDTTLTCSDLQGISSDEVSDIYEKDYWKPVNGDNLPVGVDLMVWDMAVNAGVGGSAKLLQAAIGVTVDGGIGPQTMAAVMAIDPVTLINGLADRQASYYKSLPAFKYFGTGWLNRVNARHAMALTMAANASAMVQPSLPIAQRVDPSDTPPDTFWSWIQKIF